MRTSTRVTHSHIDRRDEAEAEGQQNQSQKTRARDRGERSGGERGKGN